MFAARRLLLLAFACTSACSRPEPSPPAAQAPEAPPAAAAEPPAEPREPPTTSAEPPQEIDPPLVQPFADAHNWVLHRPVVYRIGTSADSIVVPAGFVTDFASIPAAFQSFIQVNGPHLAPSVVHDFLYWTHACTRAQSDVIFRLAMEESRVPALQRRLIYEGVKNGGQPAWNANATDRGNRLPRVIPPEFREIKAGTLWPPFRDSLHRRGVRLDSLVQITAGFCATQTIGP